MSSLLVFNKVYRLEIQSVMLVFSTQVCELLPLEPSLLSDSPPPLPKVKIQYKQTVCGWGGGGLLSCVGVETIFCRCLTLCI
jgi:hypothetical protein